LSQLESSRRLSPVRPNYRAPPRPVYTPKPTVSYKPVSRSQPVNYYVQQPTSHYQPQTHYQQPVSYYQQRPSYQASLPSDIYNPKAPTLQVTSDGQALYDPTTKDDGLPTAVTKTIGEAVFDFPGEFQGRFVFEQSRGSGIDVRIMISQGASTAGNYYDIEDSPLNAPSTYAIPGEAAGADCTLDTNNLFSLASISPFDPLKISSLPSYSCGRTLSGCAIGDLGSKWGNITADAGSGGFSQTYTDDQLSITLGDLNSIIGLPVVIWTPYAIAVNATGPFIAYPTKLYCATIQAKTVNADSSY